jgi:allantoinase
MNWGREKRFAVCSTRIMTPSGLLDGAVVVSGGRIEQVGPASLITAGTPVYDAGNLILMPGLTDTHVHINEPGRTDWEGYQTATRAAAAGGITTVVDMPLNCIPVTTSLPAFREKLAAVGRQLHVDCAYYGGVIPGNADSLKEMVAAGIVGFKAFMVHSGIDDFPKADPEDLAVAMRLLKTLDVPLLVHAELDDSDGTAVYAEHALPEPYSSYLKSRPDSWEIEAIRTVIGLSAREGCRTHVVHLSAAGAVPDIIAARKRGTPITVETCPHYLTFAAEEIADGDTRFKCAPPVRERANQDKLWQHLAHDEIDFVVSDHSPCAPHLKIQDKGDFEHAWGGIAGLQFGLPAVWSGAKARGYSEAQVARWMCMQPAALVGLSHRKGRIAAGYDADLVVFDPDKPTVPSAERIYHRHKVTPYAGRSLRGAVEATFVRGALVFERGAFPTEHAGNSLLKGHL